MTMSGLICTLKLRGKKYTKVNGKVISEWTQPADWKKAQALKEFSEKEHSHFRATTRGVSYYFGIFVKRLPDYRMLQMKAFIFGFILIPVYIWERITPMEGSGRVRS